MNEFYFKTHNQCVDYLIKNFHTRSFYSDHTRKNLVYILSFIEGWHFSQSRFAFRSMTKRRMCKHIDNWMSLHGYAYDDYF